MGDDSFVWVLDLGSHCLVDWSPSFVLVLLVDVAVVVLAMPCSFALLAFIFLFGTLPLITFVHYECMFWCSLFVIIGYNSI